MSDIRKIKDKYLKDPTFHQMVRVIRDQLERAALTPSEVREAAMLAVIDFELVHAPAIPMMDREPGKIYPPPKDDR